MKISKKIARNLSFTDGAFSFNTADINYSCFVSGNLFKIAILVVPDVVKVFVVVVLEGDEEGEIKTTIESNEDQTTTQSKKDLKNKTETEPMLPLK